MLIAKTQSTRFEQTLKKLPTTNSKKAVRKRGRPPGSTPHPEDARRLYHAARLINSGKASTPTEAFRKIADGDDTIIRRLHRKWAGDGSALLQADRRAWRERCELELGRLFDGAPQLYLDIISFAASKAGKRCLAENADKYGDPAHPMSLGLVYLGEIITEEEQKAAQDIADGHSDGLPNEPSPNDDNTVQTQQRFNRVMEAWADDGFELSVTSLRDLESRISGFADVLETKERETE